MFFFKFLIAALIPDIPTGVRGACIASSNDLSDVKTAKARQAYLAREALEQHTLAPPDADAVSREASVFSEAITKLSSTMRRRPTWETAAHRWYRRSKERISVNQPGTGDDDVLPEGQENESLA